MTTGPHAHQQSRQCGLKCQWESEIQNHTDGRHAATYYSVCSLFLGLGHSAAAAVACVFCTSVLAHKSLQSLFKGHSQTSVNLYLKNRKTRAAKGQKTTKNEY